MDIEAERLKETLSAKRLAKWSRAKVSWAVFSVILAMLALSLGGAAQGTIVNASFPVASAGGDELSPDISGDIVVWEGQGGARSEIRGKNLRTGRELSFPVVPGEPVGDRFEPKTDGDFVVWEDYRNGSNGDVYAYDIASGTEIPVAVGTASQLSPDISGGKVVWEEKRGSGWKIYGRDLTSSEPIVVSETSGNKHRPAISGDLVVWESHPGTGLSDIVGKKLGTNGEFVISNDAALFEDTPEVSGSTVVWREEGPGSYDVYAKNLQSGEEFEVCVDAADQYSPSIKGKLVVWVDGRGPSANVFGLDVESREEFLISDDGSSEDSPVIGGGTVLWEAQSDGDANFGEWDIRGSSLDENPAKPGSLTAIGTLGGVQLLWSPNSEADFDRFEVYRKFGGGALEKISTTTSSSLTDVDAPKGIVSMYEIRAVDEAGQESVAASASAAALSNTTSTLVASRTSVVFGDAVNLSGRLTSETGGIPNAAVTLGKSRAGTNAFETVATAVTDGDGGFSFKSVVLRRDTEFRASFAGIPNSGFEPSASGAVRVGVTIPETSLTANISPSVVNFGSATSVSGRLSSDVSAVAGREVVLEARPVGTMGFSVEGRARTSSTGAYSFAGLRPNKHTQYRIRFAGEAGLRPSVSRAVKAEVRAVVKTGLSATKVGIGRVVAVYGSVSPNHSGSVSVTIRENGRTTSNSTTIAVPLKDSRFRFSYRPKRFGKYAVEVSFAGDGDHLGSRGPTRSFVVKR